MTLPYAPANHRIRRAPSGNLEVPCCTGPRPRVGLLFAWGLAGPAGTGRSRHVSLATPRFRGDVCPARSRRPCSNAEVSDTGGRPEPSAGEPATIRRAGCPCHVGYGCVRTSHVRPRASDGEALPKVNGAEIRSISKQSWLSADPSSSRAYCEELLLSQNARSSTHVQRVNEWLRGGRELTAKILEALRTLLRQRIIGEA